MSFAALVAVIAQDPALGYSRFDWEAPSACPQRDTAVVWLEQRLGRPLDTPRPVVTEVHAKLVAVVPEGWRLDLTITTSSGTNTRSWVGGDCAKLAEVAVLLAAVAIDPDASTTTESPPLAIPEPTAPPEPNEVTPPPREPEGLGGSLRLGGGVDIGTLGPVTGVVLGSLALRWKAIRFDLGAIYRVIHRLDAPGPGPADALVWGTAGWLDGCGVPRTRWIEVPICAGFEAGSLAGRSRGVTVATQSRGAWAAARLGAGILVLPWRRVGFVLDARLIVPITRSRFTIDGRGDVHQVGIVTGVITAGVEIRHPFRRKSSH